MIIASTVNEKRTESIDMILSLSNEGKMAKMLAKYKLDIPLIAACPDSKMVK